jgi:hypothetical protein
VDVNLIKRYNNILIAMASGHKINKVAFEKYGIENAKYFVALYPWF